MDHSDVLLRIN